MKIDIHEQYKSKTVFEKIIIDILCDINLGYKRKTFYPIPDVFKHMHACMHSENVNIYQQ